ncbi:hypothetical protein R80B4_03138 [Fibrobacteres bacterium R8-0-B4]
MGIFSQKLRSLLMITTAVLTAGALAGTASAQTKGTFTDSRDKKAYKTVEIGGKTWMAQNLNYAAKESKCYDDDPANCAKYGRLYDWKTASSACPHGWKLPSKEAWEALVKTVGALETAAKSLKSASGWNKDWNGLSGDGTDAYGFSALPGGNWIAEDSESGGFEWVGKNGAWWTASDAEEGNKFRVLMYYGGDEVAISGEPAVFWYSVRCVK